MLETIVIKYKRLIQTTNSIISRIRSRLHSYYKNNLLHFYCILFWVTRTDRQTCSAMWWDSMTTRQLTAHYHRSQQQELAPVLVLVGGDGPRHSWIHPADRRRYTLQHSCRMVQGSSSCPLWVDATDLCCLRDLMMMMMMVCLRCEAYDVLVGAVALGHLTYTCRYLSRCELTHCFCITLADDEIAQKFDPSRPTFQGHSRSLEPTRTRTVRSGFLSCVSMRRIQTAILFYQFCLYVRLSVRCRYCL